MIRWEATGGWILTSPDFYYPANVAVRAITNLDIRCSVVYLADQGVTHPGMQVVRGKLVTGARSHESRLRRSPVCTPSPSQKADRYRTCCCSLSAQMSNRSALLMRCLVTDLAGKVVGQLRYDTGPLWDAYLPLEPRFISRPANIRVIGTARDGSRWVREAPLRTTLSSVRVEPVRPEASPARPGQSGDLQFQVTNEGRYQHTFSLHATDDLGYFQSLSQLSVTLAPRQSRTVTLRYYVPPSARAGDSATVLVSALTENREDGAAAHQTVTVLAQEEDVSAPTCTVLPGADVDCGDYLSEDDCDDRFWTVDFEVSDTGSGLQEVHVFPSEVGQLTSGQFAAGSPRLRGRYRASCCHPKANITAVDRLGNIGTCAVDLGNVSYGPVLSSTSLGLVIGGALLAFILLVLLVAFLVSRRRRSRDSRDLPTLEQQRRQERHRGLSDDDGQSSHM
ncbi:hypothetical protein FJT64_011635 [Amphibalanus amphitrite]|uniref:VWA7 Ig-like domain-containing protein n=1 Tax=Amphibalanus amphitrite TaxID=1232801 RepID=A0A6A4VAK2_AMPAM|nr:hypothetical protein FJT64_011635 [Amphibalanus amphitrite]